MSHSDSYSLQLNQPWLKWQDSGIQRLGHLSTALSLKHLCNRLTGWASDCGATHTFWWPEIQNLRESANCWWGYRADRSGGLRASLCWVFVITMINYKSRLEVISWFYTHWQWKEVWQICTQVSVRHIRVNPAPPHMGCSSQFSCWSMAKMSATALENSCTELGEITNAYW